MDPDHFEIRFMREPLGLKNFAVTYERFGGGWRAPEAHAHRRGHRQHGPGGGLFPGVRPGAGEVRRRGGRHRAVDSGSCSPETARSFRAVGEEDAVFVSIAAPQAGRDDVEFLPDYWED